MRFRTARGRGRGLDTTREAIPGSDSLRQAPPRIVSNYLTHPHDAKVLVSVQPRPGPEAVLYFGGRSEEVSWVARDAGTLFPGMAVLAVNYRGYGDSRGVPGEEHMIEDGCMLFDWLCGRSNVDKARVAEAATGANDIAEDVTRGYRLDVEDADRFVEEVLRQRAAV